MGIVGSWLVVAACASPKGIPLYDGESVVPDATALVKVTIENNRSRDITDPRFYLVGRGMKYSLGIVQGMGKRVFSVDRGVFPLDGCMSVMAHWAGGSDWVSEEFCVRPGQVVDVQLQLLLSTSNAWSHR